LGASKEQQVAVLYIYQYVIITIWLTAPLPSKIKKLRGTAQPCRMNENEPDPEPLPPDPPGHLSKDAKKYWKETFKLLASVGVLTEMDGDALTIYSQVKEKWVIATNHLRENGLVIKAPSGFPVQSPWLQIANKSYDQMVKLLSEFGMVPSSRTRVKVEFPEREDDDPMAVLRRKITGQRKNHKKPNPFDKI